MFHDGSSAVLKTFPARVSLRAQRVHVVLCAVIPLLGSVAALASTAVFPLTWFDAALVIAMWALTLGLGGTVGFHRYFAHNTFDTSPWFRVTLAILGSMSAQGPPLSWICIHRRHHAHSDREGDPHSPKPPSPSYRDRVRALWHAHCGWLIGHELPNPQHYAPDLINDRLFLRVNRNYYLWVLIGVLVPAVIAALYHRSAAGFVSGILWAGCFRIFVTAQFIWSVNSICHAFGSRSWRTREGSRNNAWLAIPSFGESWHNNHHAFPRSARFGLAWWQLDLGYWLILVLWRLRIVWNVRLAAATTNHVGAERERGTGHAL